VTGRAAGRSATGPAAGIAAGLPAALGAERMELDPQDAARDLASLVLTIVELLRQLMERQAIRRLDEGGLDPAQEERLGTALMLLDERMTQMCEAHGLRREDLGLDLGPLGTLLADEC
jgi:hypothetical protein